MIRTQLLQAAGKEPVTLADAKAHMRVEISDDDALITGLVVAARERVELLTGRKLITQKWRLYLDRFGKYDLYFQTFGPLMWRTAIDRASNHIRDEDVRWLWVPYAPVATIDALNTMDQQGNLAAFDLAANCVKDTVGEPARLVLLDTASWPNPEAGLAPANGVQLDFTVGYGTDGANVPTSLLLAIKMIAAHWYENREETTPLNLQQLPLGARALIQPYRLYARGKFD